MRKYPHKGLFIASITALFGQIYLRPFYSDFRFSLGVVAIGILILIFECTYKELLLTSLVILGFRVFLSLSNGLSLNVSLLSHFPSATYYLVYGLFLYLFQASKHLNTPVYAFSILVFADSVSNIAELILRGDFDPTTFGMRIQTILLTAILRSTFILLGYFLIRFYPEMFEKEAEKRKMATWLLNQSRLYGEVIFFEKSEDDIEKAMMKAHELYRTTRENSDAIAPQLELPRRSLAIARDVHEIKKDYRRMRQALMSLIPTDIPTHTITPYELLHYLCDDLNTYATSLHKVIVLEHTFDADLPTEHLFDAISLMNNLIINAIESIDESGQIFVHFIGVGDFWNIEVTDTGKGISDDELHLIFDPGFSTKYDPQTGHMSTGIGLAQVDYIAKHILKGQVNVYSTPGVGTKFHIVYPKASI